MPWHQLELRLPASDLAMAETFLELAGAEAISLGGDGGADILEPDRETTPVWPNIIVRALFPTEALAEVAGKTLTDELARDTRAQIRPLKDDDWIGTWSRRRVAQPIGERLVLMAAHEEWNGPARVAVKLNLGLAFGTGDHPSTALCLEWLEANPTPQSTVLDYGCGSGVLAIAALALGATAAWGVDLDPQALTASRENALLNDVDDRLWIGLPEELPKIEVDILIANILAGPLQKLAVKFRDLVIPGGRLVLSGILTAQSSSVREAYSGLFGPFSERRRDDWVCLSAPRL